ncbi:MAG: NAD(P)H-hydrate dehydratase [Actinomycetes bacterium]
MRGVHTVEEVRTAEQAVLRRIPARDLMLRAATALTSTCAQLLLSHRGGVYGASVVVLTGSGNNGGDALFSGSQLARRGAQVKVVPVGADMHQSGAQEARRRGCQILSMTNAKAAIGEADLVIDGILGIGGKGGLREPAAALAESATTSRALVVAVDLPSGVDADTGLARDDAVWADVTVTFGLMKPGLLLQPGAMHCGLVDLADIGLGEDAVVPSITSLDNQDVAGLLPHPTPLDNKYSSGVVGIVAGSAAYPGAAVLSVGGAINAKPGMVRFLGSAADDVVRAWPSAVVSKGSIEDLGRVQGWGVGPGIGTDDVAHNLLAEVLRQPAPVVVDADGLTLLARSPELARPRVAPTVLTPHAGEFARLAPDLDVDQNPITAVRTLAARMRCTVLLKGATTIVADADGQVRLNVTGTPWLATGGTGDVLTGLIAALLAAGLGGLDAASVGAYVHGLAGRIATQEAPTTSEMVARAIPEAIRTVMSP